MVFDQEQGDEGMGMKQKGPDLAGDEQLTRGPRVLSVVGEEDACMDHVLCDHDVDEADDAHMEALSLADQEWRRLLESS